SADGGGKCKPSDLRVAKTAVGTFTQGASATYTIAVSNDGPLATSGLVTLVDTLPTGLTASTLAGGGWTCVLGTLTCTRSDALPSGAVYPDITLTVNVAQNSPLSVVNTATASGGGEMDTSDSFDNETTTIVGVAQTPSVTNAATNEDTQTTSGLVISRNISDGAEVTHFKITAITNGTLFQNNGTTPIANNEFITFAQGNAGLKFTPSANFFGNGSFQVQASVSNADGGIGGGTATATITVSAVADTPSVTNATTNEDVQTTSGLVISRNAGDGVEVTHFQITGITNGSLFLNDGTTPVASGAFITFAQGNAGLKFTPAANFFGNGSFQVQSSLSNGVGGLGGGLATATITVNAVADTPSVTNATTVEDTQTTSGLVISRNAADGAEVTHFKITAITNGTLFLNDGTTPVTNNTFVTFAQGNAGLKFTPSANFFGNGTFQIQASTSNSDAGLGGGVITATITVNAVADTPSVTNATTNEDTQTTSGLVISRNAADGAEVTHFKITNITNGTLFQNDGVTPIASNAFITFAQGNAGLKFTPNANFFGSGTFQVQASLAGNDGGLGGGVITVTITVNPVADTPSVTNSTTNEDTQTTSGLVNTRNAADGNEVTHFKITAITNGTLFQNDGTTPIANNAFITFAQANAGLKFTPAANLFSPSTPFTFQLQASLSNADAGLGGGVVTATITVNPVADTPSVTNATTVHGAQTTSGLVVSRNAVDGAEVTHFKITNITNGTLFQNNGTTPIANNAFITFAQANAGLRFTPNIGFIGTATFQIQASVSNVDAGLGGGVITANIVVNKADTTTTIVSSLNPSPLGTPVTFTSTTVITPPGQGPINGTVTFLDGASPIAGCTNVAVNGAGQAQCATSTLTSGSHVITAQYLGSATFNTSSGTVTQVVDLPPTAAGTAPTVVTGGGTTHTVTVTYTDDFAINVASLDSNDIRVTGPNAFNSAVTFTGVNINTNGTPRVATYTFTAPGGSWDLGDNGTYSIVMQANQVVDSANQPVAAGSIGTFVVNIPPVTISGNIRQYVAGGPNTPLAGVTVTLTSNNVPVPGPVTTNANGDYVIPNVSHGANIVVTPSGLGKVYDPI
ncbi:MAG: Ig-like domain repeat protein, partial [Pyrinomonadaceae bacterium]